MAAANPQSHITLSTFRRKPEKNLPDFESLLRSLTNVGIILNANRPQFFQLSLPDQALQFFRTLSKATKNDFDAAITAPGNHYCSPNVRELHKLQLHNQKFDHKIGNLEGFLVQMQSRATPVYPDTVFPPFPPTDPPVNQARNDRVQPAQDASRATLNNTVHERNRRIRKIFMDAMPNVIRKETPGPNCGSSSGRRVCSCRTPKGFIRSLSFAQTTTGQETLSMRLVQDFRKT